MVVKLNKYCVIFMLVLIPSSTPFDPVDPKLELHTL